MSVELCGRRLINNFRALLLNIGFQCSCSCGIYNRTHIGLQFARIAHLQQRHSATNHLENLRVSLALNIEHAQC